MYFIATQLISNHQHDIALLKTASIQPEIFRVTRSRVINFRSFVKKDSCAREAQLEVHLTHEVYLSEI